MTPGEQVILGVLLLMFSTMPPHRPVYDIPLMLCGVVLCVVGLCGVGVGLHA